MAKTMDNGRPKGKARPGQSIYDDFERVCKRNSLTALEVVLKVMNNEEADIKHRLVAAQTIMDRAWGKAKQSVDTNISLTIEGVAEVLNAARLRAIEYDKAKEVDG